MSNNTALPHLPHFPHLPKFPHLPTFSTSPDFPTYPAFRTCPTRFISPSYSTSKIPSVHLAPPWNFISSVVMTSVVMVTVTENWRVGDVIKRLIHELIHFLILSFSLQPLSQAFSKWVCQTVSHSAKRSITCFIPPPDLHSFIHSFFYWFIH